MFQKLTAWQVNRALDQGKGAKAEIVARAYAEKRPKDPMAWVMWGHVLARQSDFDQAKAVLLQGMETHPSSLDIATPLALILAQLGNHDQCVRLWLALRDEHPDSPIPYVGLATVAVSERNYEEGRSLVEEALKRHPPPELLGELASTVLYIPGERQRAEEMMERAADSSHNPGLYILLSLLLSTRDPASAARLTLVAKSYYRRKPRQFEEQITYFKEVLESNPPPLA